MYFSTCIDKEQIKLLVNNKYLEKLNDRKNNWIEIDDAILRKTIVDYLKSNIAVEV